MADPKRLLVAYDGKVVFDGPTESVYFEVQSPHQEIISNPALAAALGGSDPEVYVNLPGERVIGWMVETTATLAIKVHIDLGTKIKMVEERTI